MFIPEVGGFFFLLLTVTGPFTRPRLKTGKGVRSTGCRCSSCGSYLRLFRPDNRVSSNEDPCQSRSENAYAFTGSAPCSGGRSALMQGTMVSANRRHGATLCLLQSAYKDRTFVGRQHHFLSRRHSQTTFSFLLPLIAIKMRAYPNSKRSAHVHWPAND